MGTGWDGDKTSGDGVGIGHNLWTWGEDGDRNNGDGWGWGQVLVPMGTSSCPRAAL